MIAPHTPLAQRAARMLLPAIALAGVAGVLLGCAPDAVDPAADRGAPPSPPTPTAASDPDTSAPTTPQAVPPTAPAVASSAASPTPPPVGPPALEPAPGRPVVRGGGNVSPAVEVGEPTRIAIPSLGIDGPVTATGVLTDGMVEVPDDPAMAGWFREGPRPGEQGPATIIGHVDSRASGPGIFHRLVELEAGAEVVVETTSGSQRFVVRSVEQYPKDRFPTDLVYGAAPGSTLRLVTCGGSFDQAARSYRDNVIAFLDRSTHR